MASPLGKTRLLRLVAERPWIGPALALVAVYALFFALSPSTFARPQNLVTMARQTVVVAMAGCGMTLVIIMGGIDLSVGSVVALTTVVVASLLKMGAGAFTAAVGGVVAAAVTGLVTGLLVTRLRISPFIVTLGGMSILRGAAKGLAHEQKIDVDARGLDTLLTPLSPEHAYWLLPPGVWMLLVGALLTTALLHYTRFGRHVTAVGSNEATALICGVNTRRIKTLVYGISGALAGVAGIVEFSTLTVGDPTDSVGLELEVIAAVVIGGGSLAGGQGSVLGALLGALLMTVIKTGCTHIGLANWVQELVTGVIIVLAVVLDRLRRADR